MNENKFFFVMSCFQFHVFGELKGFKILLNLIFKIYFDMITAKEFSAIQFYNRKEIIILFSKLFLLKINYSVLKMWKG